MSQRKRPWQMSPSEMQEALGQYVINQDDALRVVTENYWINTQRRLAKKLGKSSTRYPPKANVMLAAPTGSGKTFLLRTFMEHLKIPVVHFDATTLSAEGYVGNKPRHIIESLLAITNGDEKAARRAIVHLDEVDKIKDTGRKGDVSGIAVQESLLTFLEGVPIILNDGRLFDTSDLTIVATGAFQRLDRKEGERWVSDHSLAAYGFNRQFVARFAARAWMNKLGKAELRRILLESKASVVNRLVNSFRDWNGVDLEFTDGAINAITEAALQAGTGARALDQVAKTALSHVERLLSNRVNGIKKYIVEAETVTEGREPRIIRGRSDYVPLDLGAVEDDEPGTPIEKSERRREEHNNPKPSDERWQGTSPPLQLPPFPSPSPEPPRPELPPPQPPVAQAMPRLVPETERSDSPPPDSPVRKKLMLVVVSSALVLLAGLVFLLAGSDWTPHEGKGASDRPESPAIYHEHVGESDYLGEGDQRTPGTETGGHVEMYRPFLKNNSD